jgi:hypothetical protein
MNKKEGVWNKTKECPDPEKLVLAARLELPLKQRLAVMDHIDNCASCAREFKAIIAIIQKEKEFLQQIKDEIPKVKEKKSPWLIRNRPVLAAASAVFLLLAAAVFFLFVNRPAPFNLRSSQSIIEAISPFKTVKASQLQFNWESARGTEFYRINIFGDDLGPIWESGKIFVTEWTPGPEIKSRLQSGKTYFWMVTAHRPDGSTRESDLIEFSLK